MKEFDKIIGYNGVKAELERICDIMLNSEKYKKLGVSTPQGLLLHGKPGVGKTLMANCLINASGRKAYICRKDKPDGSFVIGIRRIFLKAKENAPSIVFLDDLDKFSNEDYIHRNSEEFVTVQTCIDDCKGSEVFVLATVNDMRSLPGSLRRAGRFDKIIEVENPRGEDAVEIVRYYLSSKSFVGDIDAREIARILNGRSCAELETVINEAGLIAGFSGKDKIEMDDMVKACMRVIFQAPENKDNNPAITERVAWHEAGHAVIAELTDPESVTLVSVHKHGTDISGVTTFYSNDSYYVYKKKMENNLMTALGGKAATEIKYGETDTGCNSDLHKAFDISSMFTDNYCSTSFDRFVTSRESSDAIKNRKEMQISFEVERFYAKARRLLILNYDFLNKVACALMEKSTLTASDIKAIKNTCSISL
ncbi:MAG: AAA family ATPase [Clostridia bacterium]|nr:AAA family ATPase [Clostridia bacterium]